jgi:hypothetical protein
MDKEKKCFALYEAEEKKKSEIPMTEMERVVIVDHLKFIEDCNKVIEKVKELKALFPNAKYTIYELKKLKEE